MEIYYPRLLAAAKEFNIGADTLIDFLISKGFEQSDLKKTSKLSEEMYITLIKEFQGDKVIKERSSRFKFTKYDVNDKNLSLPTENNKKVDITINNPKVFISYSWDDTNHTNWVLNLANNLCKNGIVVLLDQYDLRTGRNLSHFMEDAITRSEKVLIIMTENYATKADGRKGGVGYEYSIISSDFFKHQSDNKKYIPILRGLDKIKSIPSFLNSYVYLDMSNEHDYANSFNHLIRDIFETHKIIRPEIGKIPDHILEDKRNQSSR